MNRAMESWERHHRWNKLLRPRKEKPIQEPEAKGWDTRQVHDRIESSGSP